MDNIDSNISGSDELVGIEEVQKFLNRSRASVYRYTNTDPRNLNPSFNPRKLNPEFRTDQKEPLKFHPNEIARFAKDILRIKEVTVEVFNSPSSAAQNVLMQILDELKIISEFKGDDDEPPSIRGFSLTFLGFFLAFLTIFFPLIIVLLGRPTSQINEMTINQSIKKDGS